MPVNPDSREFDQIVADQFGKVMVQNSLAGEVLSVVEVCPLAQLAAETSS